MTKRIMITGAGGPAGINFTLSLRIVSEKMALIGSEANKHYVKLARTDNTHIVPPATASDYIDSINHVITKENVDFVHPQPDIEVTALSENREKLLADTYLPSKTTVRICQDKLKSAEVWERNDIPTAKTIPISSESDIRHAFEQLGAPVWIRAKRGAGGKGSTPANTVETASSWINYWKTRKKHWEFIAQENLPGKNIAFHSIWNNGEIITSMARERILYIYPELAPSGITGTPSVQRTIHNEQVNKIATEAVLAIDQGFTGIACVDMKENAENTPCATEINAGRMFTTSFFFAYASKKLLDNHYANFPYLYTQLAYKEQIAKIPRYNILPQDIYWIRHMDAPARLVKAGRILGEMYS